VPVPRRSKKKWSWAADLAAAYGPEVLAWGDEPPDYECVVGLWLNRDRPFVRECLAVTSGIGAALSGQIPAAWWGSVTDNPDQARQMAERAAARRRTRADADVEKVFREGRWRHSTT